VLLSPTAPICFSQKVINASMGSFARVTVHTAALAEALAGVKVPAHGLRSRGRRRACAYARRDAVIVIGNEGRGLSPACRPRSRSA